MYGLSGKSLNSRVDEVLEPIGLVEKAKNQVKTYSGGMKRRVNIGVGLLNKPRLLSPTRSSTPPAYRRTVVRQMPFTPERVRAALLGRGQS